MKAFSIFLLLLTSTQSLSYFLRLPSKQERFVQKDAPLSDPFWESEAQTLWFFGKNHLWIWDTKSPNLKKLTHHALKNRKQVLFAHNKIFVATENQLLVIKQSDKTIVTLHQTHAKQGVVGLHKENDNIIFTSSGSIVIVDPSDLSIRTRDHNVTITGVSHYLQGRFWVFNGDLTLINNEGKNRLLSCGAESPKPQILEQSIMQYCSDKFYRFTPDGRLIQVVTNVNRYRPIAWSFQHTVHAFLFENKTLEVLNLQAKKKESFQINYKLSQFTLENHILAGLTRNFPVVELLKNRSAM